MLTLQNSFEKVQRNLFRTHTRFVSQRANLQSLPALPAGGKPGRLSDHAREGDVVILDRWGNVYELNQRTTGDSRP